VLGFIFNPTKAPIQIFALLILANVAGISYQDSFFDEEDADGPMGSSTSLQSGMNELGIVG